MSNLEDFNKKLEIAEGTGVQESEQKPSTSGMSGDRPQRRAGRRPGRRGSKMDERAKLERSRQSARECRARKKLRYQYLEDLVANREKAVFALRDELELYKQWCIQLDKGLMPLALLKLAEEEDEKSLNVQKLLTDFVVISDSDEDDSDQSDDGNNTSNAADLSEDTPVAASSYGSTRSYTTGETEMKSTRPDIVSDGNPRRLSSLNREDPKGFLMDNSGASGSISDILIQPGRSDLRLDWNTAQFGTLDENLKFASGSPVNLEVVENVNHNETDTVGKSHDKSLWKSSLRASLPTINEEN